MGRAPRVDKPQLGDGVGKFGGILCASAGPREPGEFIRTAQRRARGRALRFSLRCTGELGGPDPDPGDGADVAGPAAIPGHHQLAAVRLQQPAVHAGGEQHGRIAEVRVGLRPGQHRVVPVAARDGGQEARAVLAPADVEGRARVRDDLPRQRPLERVVSRAFLRAVEPAPGTSSGSSPCPRRLRARCAGRGPRRCPGPRPAGTTGR